MGYDIPPKLKTGGYIGWVLRWVGCLLREREMNGVHGVHKVHEQRIDVINNGQRDRYLDKAEHDRIPISFSII